MKRVLFLFIGFSLSASVLANDDIDAAFGLCAILDNTGLITECDVSGWGKSVDVRMDTSGAEARQVCTLLSNKYGAEFSPGWDLNILNPYSGNNAVATCKLS